MNILDDSLLTTILTLAATFLGLSIVVQVIQELYKYLRSSKAKVYEVALIDFFRLLAHELLQPSFLLDILIGDSMQIMKVRSKSWIFLFNKEERSYSLERSAPPWIDQTLNKLNYKVDCQSDNFIACSISLEEYLNELGKVL